MIAPVYQVLLSADSEKFLAKLHDKKLYQRIINALLNLRQIPLPSGSKKLVGQPHYRIRVGDYRIIYEIRRHQLIVNVVKVGHRKDIYR